MLIRIIDGIAVAHHQFVIRNAYWSSFLPYPLAFSLIALDDDDGQRAPVAEARAGLVYGVGDVAVQLAGYLDGLDTDGARELDGVQQRRAELSDLVRRHGTSLDDVLGILDSGSARLLELDRDDERIDELAALAEQQLARATALAADLTALRTGAAERLGLAVSDELAAIL